MLSLNIFLLFSLPSFFIAFFGASSLSIGLFFYLFLFNFIYILNYRIVFNKKEIFIVILIIFLLMVSGFMSFAFQGELKPLISVLMFSVVLFSAILFSKMLQAYSTEQFVSSIFAVSVVFLFFGYLKFIYVPKFLGYVNAKATFPFVEESHFALAYGFLSLIYVFLGSNKKSFFLIANSFLLSFFFPSLTLLIFSFLMVLAYFPKNISSKSIKVLFFVFFIISFFLYVPSVEYFSDRLSFEESNNVTTLVFLQGLDLAIKNFSANGYLGLGFQMLGLNSSTVLSNISFKISLLNNNYNLNLTDGGFLMSKFVSEFGFIGFLFSLFYLYFIIKFYYNYYSSNAISGHGLFVNAVLFSFVVEFLLRGYGYFSPAFFFVITILFLRLSINKRGVDKL